jgi:hypothetical protein
VYKDGIEDSFDDEYWLNKLDIKEENEEMRETIDNLVNEVDDLM